MICRRLQGKYPGIRDRLGYIVEDDGLKGEAVVDRWQTGLSRLRETLDSAKLEEPDSRVADRLAKCVDDLRKIALEAEAERLADFSSSLAEVMRKHRDVLSDRTSLKPYMQRIEQYPPVDQVPEDADDLVNELDSMLRSLAEVVDGIRHKYETAVKADAQARDQLDRKIADLRATEVKTARDVENLFSRLFDNVDLGSNRETTKAPLNPSFSGASEGSGDRTILDVEDEGSTLSGHGDSDDDEAIVPRYEDVLGEQPEVSERDVQEGEGASPRDSGEALTKGDVLQDTTSIVGELPVTTDSVVEDPKSRIDTSSTETTSISASIEEKGDTSDSSSESTPSPTDQTFSAESSPRDEGHSPEASKALDGMLSSRRFARAYWLTRADRTLGDPDLFGALCEGARIGPGDPCPGALIHFFDVLAGKDQWQDEERLLLSASILGPCLFVDPLPQRIYSLAENRLPADTSPVGPLMKKVRELCVRQSAKIRLEDLGGESVDATRVARLDQLGREADQFIHRVPHIRFQYAPASSALQFLYRAGSEWHRLHTIIGGNHVNRLSEARTLVRLLNPGQVVANLPDDAELPTVRKPLDGSARDKLTRHLHDTLALAGQWIRLSTASEEGNYSGGRQSDTLLRELETLLPSAREALMPAKGRGAVDALDCVLEDLEARVQGRDLEEFGAISGDLLLLPGLELEDDLEPVDNNLEALRTAILEAERSQPDSEVVLHECLDRGEYRRARDIIRIHQLGESSDNEYQDTVRKKRSALETELRELELEIEDAFLLGQLRDDAGDDGLVGDQTANALERSRLLRVVRDSEQNLGQFEDSEGGELRNISRKIDDVRAKVEKMTGKRQERLRHKFETVMEDLPRTDQGEADRDYLREEFDKCMEGNDHVAAFDLLDRGQKAAEGREAVARASTGSSQELELFLQRADGYRGALSKPEWLPQVEESIRNGNTFSEIAFGQLDLPRRDEAIRAVRTWNSMTKLRFTKTRRELKESMEDLLRFIGLPLQEGGIQIADTTQPGLTHIHASLARSVTSSPLPAFGSACGNRFEVVVCQTRKEPEQVEEYIQGRGLAGIPVLAVLLPPQTSAYRTRWQHHFVRARLTVIPVDSVFLLHLCGERNRLPVLFKLGLPFTWARPYITKGENVPSEMFVGRRDETAALMDPAGSCIVFGGRQLGEVRAAETRPSGES